MIMPYLLWLAFSCCCCLHWVVWANPLLHERAEGQGGFMRRPHVSEQHNPHHHPGPQQLEAGHRKHHHRGRLVNNSTGSSAFQSLPVFPPELFSNIESASIPIAVNQKKIPKIFWVAVVNATEVSEWKHIKRLQEMHPDWTINIWDNAAKDKFMRDHFTDSKVLWAYENINPAVGGAAKADIWRYAVLLLRGGVYIDSDSGLFKPIDEYILPSDELILGYENNDYDADWCYSSHYKHSTLMQVNYFKKLYASSNVNNENIVGTGLDASTIESNMKSIFHGRMILNWCIMSAPYHQYLKNALENFVKLSELEYIGLSAVKMQKYDKYSKHIYCTTGPFMLTATCREAALHMMLRRQNPQQLLQKSIPVCEKGFLCNHRLTSKDFSAEGARFKVVAVNKDPKHYTHAKHDNFLLSYADFDTIKNTVQYSFLIEIDKNVIKGRSKPDLYYLDNKLKRSIDNMDIFLAYNLSLVHVIHLSDQIMSLIADGPPLPMP